MYSGDPLFWEGDIITLYTAKRLLLEFKLKKSI